MAWTFETLHIGDNDSIRKKVTAELVAAFAEISNDYNPVHMNETFAKETPFGGRIAHGMLSVGLISAVLGTKIPGQGSVYMSQTVRFKKPVYLNETVTAWAEVKEKIEDKKRVIMHTKVENDKGDVVLDGEAMLLFNV